MRHLTRAVVVLACLAAGPLVRPAAAVSVEELFNLKAAGLSDDVLVALIEADGSVFRLSVEDVVALHKRGLGEKVIVAMIASARKAQPSPADAELTAAPEAPAPIPLQQTIVQNVEAPTATATAHVVVERAREVVVPVAVPVYVRPVEPARPPKPVYWGYGGNQRPDSWRPAPERESKPDPKQDAKSETKSEKSTPVSKSR
jgi:hypothetical protein